MTESKTDTTPPATSAAEAAPVPEKKPTFKLDGRELPFEKGDTIITAAFRQGIEIPHYCWHPGLSVAANCRMCLVELEPAANQRPMMLDILRWDGEAKDYVVDRKPKLQPACQQAVSEGLSVKSETSPHVALARKNVQEFLLLNHPVDCPICDQAGECKLQDYYMREQRTAKRMRDEPVHKPKAQVFGDTIVYDAERCIACTRCIRFCDEVAGDHMLDMRERGNLYEITVAPGRRLEGKYTMMTEHVCPVGALTTNHWRHKGRVWLLKSTTSVCPGCATGCNTWVDVDGREQKAFRTRPRDNQDVNKYWLCDDGMLTYLREHQDRVLRARVGRGSDEEEALPVALEKAASVLKDAGTNVAVVLSAQASSEDNLVAVDLAKALGAKLYLSGKPPWQGDKILRNEDQNPNRKGALAVAGADSLPGWKELFAARPSAVLVLGADADVDDATLSALGSGMSQVVVLATNKGPVLRHGTVVLPMATFAETEGTFVNAKGMSQGFKKALAPKGDALPGWELLSRLGRTMKLEIAYKKFSEVRGALVARTSQSPAVGRRDESVNPVSGTPRSGV